MAKNFKKLYSNGFSLAELLVVIGIIVILVSFIISSFNKTGGSEALNISTISVISVLNSVKSMAISSKDASNYGVRIFSNKLVSFKNVYGTDNQETTLSNLVILNTSFGIGSDIIFSNVSGSPSQSGTISITVLNDATKQNIITLYSTGLIEKN